MVKKKLEHMDEPELRRLMTECCSALKYQISQRMFGTPQFAILIFNDPKLAQYGSTCERATMIEALRETADRLEANEDVKR